MANSNILEGWKCPKCNNEDEFEVIATTWATLQDDGAEASDLEYDERSYARCPQCYHDGTVATFTTKPEEASDEDE